MTDCLFSIFAHTKTHTHTVSETASEFWFNFFLFNFYPMWTNLSNEKLNTIIKFNSFKSLKIALNWNIRSNVNRWTCSMPQSLHQCTNIWESLMWFVSKKELTHSDVYIYIRIYINECNRTREKQKRNQQTKLYSILSYNTRLCPLGIP